MVSIHSLFPPKWPFCRELDSQDKIRVIFKKFGNDFRFFSFLLRVSFSVSLINHPSYHINSNLCLNLQDQYHSSPPLSLYWSLCCFFQKIQNLHLKPREKNCDLIMWWMLPDFVTRAFRGRKRRVSSLAWCSLEGDLTRPSSSAITRCMHYRVDWVLNGMKSSRGCGYIGCKAPLWMCVALAGWLLKRSCYVSN